MSQVSSGIRFLSRRPARVPRPLLPIASVALLAGGYTHLCLYRHGYRAIPTIGRLFALNVAASAVAAAIVLFRRELIARVVALGVALTTLGFFVASRLPGGVFRFQERGFQPSPQAAEALIAELVAVATIGLTFIWDRGS